ncbi:hypothetical protein INS13_14875 [Staphylococcus epidermidis]|nr:hypothetical protein [Staphylococcus epidermidis]
MFNKGLFIFLKGVYSMYKKVLASLSVTGLLFTSSVGIADYHINGANAQEEKSTNAQVKVAKINDGQFKVVPNKYAEGKVKDGKATIVDKKTGKSEKLPLKVKNKNDKQVNVSYKIVDNNIVGDVKLSENNGTAVRETNWKKCTLGTGGAALGGAGGGVASGAGYGAIGATPVSVGVGSAIGGVIGGVSAGMGGAAASCFD